MNRKLCSLLPWALSLPLVLTGCVETPTTPSGDSASASGQADAPLADAPPADATAPPAVAADSGIQPGTTAPPAVAATPDSAAAAADPGTVPFPARGGETVADEPPAPLMLGDAAPPIRIAAWAKGAPVESFQKDKVYVVEFWATWCGPCRTSMPHMSDLQVQYGDKVQFIGVTDEDMETVSGFMQQPGVGGETWEEVIKYAIALDENGGTSEAYMRAANQNGIPTAFIVGGSGRVEWIGHPMGMDDPLKQIVEGTWDVDAAREQFIAGVREEEDMMKAMPGLQQAMRSGAFPDAVRIMEGLLQQHPQSERIQMILLQILLQSGDKEKLNVHAASVISNFEDSAQHLNQIAWMMATMNETEGVVDLELALKAATRASELTDHKDSSILDTVARVFHEKGSLAEAIEWQKKAVAAGPDEINLAQTLEEYEAEAKPADSAPEEPKSEDPAPEDPAPEDPAPEEPASSDN